MKWVDDGTRVFGEESVREDNAERLRELLAEHGVEYISISVDFGERLSTAIHHVDKLIGN